MTTPKTQELFVELTDYGVIAVEIARDNSNYVLTKVGSSVSGDLATVREFFKNFSDARRGFYIPMYCGISPASGFVHRVNLEFAGKVKTPGYVEQVLKDEMAIDAANYAIRVLNGTDGMECNLQESTQKHLVMCGALKAEIDKIQDSLIHVNLYPERLELNVMAQLGVLLNYSLFKNAPMIGLNLWGSGAQLGICNNGQIDLARLVSFGVNSVIPLIQKELSLEDEASARQLLFSNTFDFTDKGRTLLAVLIDELRAAIDYYEVQTGHRIDAIYVGGLPSSFAWIGKTISQVLGLAELNVDFDGWLANNGLQLNAGFDRSTMTNKSFGVVGLAMAFAKRTKGTWR